MRDNEVFIKKEIKEKSMGMYKATVHQMKENVREKSVVFEPTIKRKDSIDVKESQKPKYAQGMGENAPFAMSLTEASRKFKKRFL